MVVLPSSRVLRSHARLAKSAVGLAAALLLIHWLEMHLISIQGFDFEMYFILIEILKNALFLQLLYFESNFEKCTEGPKCTPCVLDRCSIMNFGAL